MHKQFKLNVQAVVVNNGAVLLLKRHGKWTLPGGRFEDDDKDIEAALRREIFEETAIRGFKVGPILKAILSVNKSTVLLYFRVNTEENQASISHEHEDHAWVNIDQLDDVKFEYEELRNIVKSAHG